ncbi:MAG: hypothetical protein ACRCUH_14310 [Shewanella sp.]
MQERANKLLMMFISDAYGSTGRASKKTAIAMMKFVGQVDGLQDAVNGGDKKQITSFNLNFVSKDD